MEGPTYDQVGRMSVDDKARLLAGADSWHSHPLPLRGNPVVKFSDGPNGIRGAGQGGQQTPAVAIPVAIAIGASFDPELAGSLGELLGREALRKQAHAVLGPGLNLHRTPIGGRTFEYYSEDPELAAQLGSAMVAGIQSQGVAAVIKHFVCNDTEVDRLTVDVDVDEMTLREVYLRPFHRAVVEAGAMAVMSAYNRLGGPFCAEHRWLLTDLLRDEWAFDGIVVSDWFGAHDTVGAATGGLTLEMPGPARIFGTALAEAVRAGEVAEDVVDRQVEDLMRFAARAGAIEHQSVHEEQSVDDPSERALCRRAAVAGTVLLKNDSDALPLEGVGHVAVLGPNAADTQIMGGGSSSLRPLPHTSILDALREEDGLEVVFEPGVSIERFAPLPTDVRSPGGTPGLRVEFLNGDDVVHVGTLDSPIIRHLGSVPAGVDPDNYDIRIRGSLIPDRDGPHRVGAIVTGPARVVVGGQVVIDDPDGSLPKSDNFYGFGTDEVLVEVACTRAQPLPLEIDLHMDGGFGGLRVGLAPPTDGGERQRALDIAAKSDAAIIVVGTNEDWESEGYDRDDMRLPGDQDDFVRQVAAVNDRTIVVVNVGGPAAMPWADEVSAILLPFYAGIEAGPAVADMLLGRSDPGGRLPTTLPADWGTWPVAANYQPVDGQQVYAERDRFGYRGWQGTGIEPAFHFGFGLTYGQIELTSADVRSPSHDDGEIVIDAIVANRGVRAGSAVLQAYLDDEGTGNLPRLVGFAKATVPPGDEATIAVAVRPDAFDHWAPGQGWTRVNEPRRLTLATSSRAEDVVELGT